MSAMQNKQQVRPSKLFLGGLTRHTTTKDLRDHFTKYGRVLDCVAMRQPDGRPRGFGYVTLDSPAAADRCLAEPQIIDGRVIDMKRAVPGTSDDGTPKGSNSSRSARGGRVFGSTPSTRSGTPSEGGAAGMSPFGFGPWDAPGAAGGYLSHMPPYSPSHWGAAAPWGPDFSAPSPKAMAADLFEVLSPASALCRTPGAHPFSGGAVCESLGLLTTPGGSSSGPGCSSSAAAAAAAAAGGSTPTTLFAMTPSAPRSALSMAQGGVEDSTPQKVELPTPFKHRSVLGDITNLAATSPDAPLEAPLPSPLGGKNQHLPRGGTPVYAGKENASSCGLFLPANAVTPRKRHSPSGFPIIDETLCIPELPEEEAEEEEQAAAAVANTMAARKIIMPPPGLSPPRYIRDTSSAFLSTMAPGLA